jgi:hypothetical protein
VSVCGEFDRLRIDVVRTARRDVASSEASLSSTDAAPQLERQIETIVYYVVASEEVAAQAISADSQQSRGGLVRRSLSRPMAAWAAEFGSLEYRDTSVAPLASEVKAVEFRYHDGDEWLESWDTATTGSLPKAIEIRLFLAPVPSSNGRPVESTDSTELPDVQYRLIVPIPTLAAPATASAATSTTGESTTPPPSSATTSPSDSNADGSGGTP